MQGDTDGESNFIQLLKLRVKDLPILLKWLERKEDRYTSHDIQHEIIVIVTIYNYLLLCLNVKLTQNVITSTQNVIRLLTRNVITFQRKL